MANDNNVSVDEFLSTRKDFVKSGDVLVKAAVNPPASWNKDARTARFVMSAEIEDRDKDIVVQDGLDMTEFLKNPVAPFSHKSSDFPVGTWIDVEKLSNGRPKRTEGTLKLLPEGKDGVADRLAFHIGSGTIRACSIGFIPKAIKRREQAQEPGSYSYPGYMIESAELVECSPCAIPANPAAMAKAAAAGDTIARDLIEEVLDTWAKNPANGLLMPRSAFEQAYKEATGDKSVIVIGGKSFTLTEVQPAPETTEETILKRIEGMFAKVFGESAEAAAARKAAETEAAAKAATELAERRTALAAKAAEIEGRVSPKVAA